jgi:hypothetical protein
VSSSGSQPIVSVAQKCDFVRSKDGGWRGFTALRQEWNPGDASALRASDGAPFTSNICCQLCSARSAEELHLECENAIGEYGCAGAVCRLGGRGRHDEVPAFGTLDELIIADSTGGELGATVDAVKTDGGHRKKRCKCPVAEERLLLTGYYGVTI